MNLNKNTKILIVGLGLIGGSYADSLSSNGYYVGAIDTNQKSIDFALNKGIISSGTIETDGNYIGKFDIIIFAVYPHTIIDWVTNNQKYIKEKALLSDVTGVKGCFIYEVQKLLRNDLEFIGAHPMAGKESSGAENSSKEIFCGSNFIITPTDRNTKDAIKICEMLANIMGFGNVSILTPEKHDEIIAFISQLEHCLAISLMTCRDMTGMNEFSGDSFRDLTRIAKINDEMWSELFLKNKAELVSQMNLFLSAFERLKKYITDENRDEIIKMMKESTKQRIIFDKAKE